MTETKNTNLVIAQAMDTHAVIAEMAITNNATLTQGAELRTNIKRIEKAVTAEKEKRTRPLLDALEVERARWRPAEAKIKEALAIIDKKILAYNDAIEAERKRKEAQIAARVERGTMKAVTAVAKLDKLVEAPTNITTENGSISYRVDKVVAITNKALIPQQFLIVDEVAVKRALLAGETVPGAELQERKTIVNKTK